MLGTVTSSCSSVYKTFQTNISLPSSRPKSKPRNKSAESGGKLSLLNMEAMCSSETSGYPRTKCRYNQRGQSYENFKSVLSLLNQKKENPNKPFFFGLSLGTGPIRLLDLHRLHLIAARREGARSTWRLTGLAIVWCHRHLWTAESNHFSCPLQYWPMPRELNRQILHPIVKSRHFTRPWVSLIQCSPSETFSSLIDLIV